MYFYHIAVNANKLKRSTLVKLNTLTHTHTYIYSILILSNRQYVNFWGLFHVAAGSTATAATPVCSESGSAFG
jgi:hypothetical protein